MLFQIASIFRKKLNILQSVYTIVFTWILIDRCAKNVTLSWKRNGITGDVKFEELSSSRVAEPGGANMNICMKYKSTHFCSPIDCDPGNTTSKNFYIEFVAKKINEPSHTKFLSIRNMENHLRKDWTNHFSNPLRFRNSFSFIAGRIVYERNWTRFKNTLYGGCLIKKKNTIWCWSARWFFLSSQRVL